MFLRKRRSIKHKLDRFIRHPYTDTVIIVLILISILLVIYESTLNENDPLDQVLVTLDWIIIGIFVVELSIRFYVAPRKRVFFRRYWIDIIAIIPLFRTFRILRVLRLLRIFRMGILINRRLSRFTSFFSEAYGEYLSIGIVVLVVILGGSVSLYLLENEMGQTGGHFHPFYKAFYWTFYTLIAGEMAPGEPQTAAGYFVTIIVMLSGLTMFAMFTGIVSAAMVQRLKLRMEDKFMDLEDLEHHIIICGWNRKARSIIEELQVDENEKHRHIVLIAEVDKMPSFDPHLVNREMIYFIPADYTNVDVLQEANVTKADKAIILADKTRTRSDQDRDARTVLTALTIEKLNPTIFTCAELLNHDNEMHLHMAGVEEVIVGDDYAATVLATSAANRGIIHLVKELLTAKYGNQLMKVIATKRCQGMSFLELSDYLKEDFNAILLSVERKINGKIETHVNPPKSFSIEASDHLIVIAQKRFFLPD